MTFRGPVVTVVQKATKNACKLHLEHGFDGCADVDPQPLLDRVELDVRGVWPTALGISNLFQVYGTISLAAAAGWVDVNFT
jgi:hypothetical protein